MVEWDCLTTFCDIFIIIWEVFFETTRLRFSVIYYFIQRIYDSIESKKKYTVFGQGQSILISKEKQRL